MHRLFDQGYLTITTDHRLEVSPRLKLDYDNGRTYYPFHGAKLVFPKRRRIARLQVLFNGITSINI
jgi:putative restriction endonuclease